MREPARAVRSSAICRRSLPGPIGKFIVQQMAAVAELEAGLISQRTKAALAQSKKKLGGYRGGPKVDGKLVAAARKSAADDFAARRPVAKPNAS